MKYYREGPSHFAPLLHWQNVVLRHSFSSATIESEHQAGQQKNNNEVWMWSKSRSYEIQNQHSVAFEVRAWARQQVIVDINRQRATCIMI